MCVRLWGPYCNNWLVRGTIGLRRRRRNFDKHCAVDPDFADKPQTERYRGTVMTWLFAELVSLRRPLKELGIQNYQNVAPPPGTTSDQIKQVLVA